jgi:hypothetical protein
MEEERIFKERPKLSELFAHRKVSGEDIGSFSNSQRNSGVQNESGRNILAYGANRLVNNSIEKYYQKYPAEIRPYEQQFIVWQILGRATV